MVLNPHRESTTILPLNFLKIKNTVSEGNSKKASEALNLPARYHGKALPDNRQSKEALKAVLSGQSLFITGSCGSGKTHLSVALMNAWFADGMKEAEGKIYQSKGRGVFLPAVELFLEIKQTFNGEGSEKDILDKYSEVALLVIDDLGAEKMSDWSRVVLYLLIDRRYRDMKQTIITSNLSHGELAEKLDDRIASRISEMGVIYDLGRKDWRIS